MASPSSGNNQSSVSQSIIGRFFRSGSSATDMSTSNNLLQHMFDNHENSRLLDPVDMGHLPHGRPGGGKNDGQDSVLSSIPPAAADTLKRSHWKNVARYERCSEKRCSKKFSKRDKKRNCTMCGEVFCKNCTRFTRSLSSQATPDPLGTAYHVCHTCLMATVQNMGQEGNWLVYYEFFRDKKKEQEQMLNAVNQTKPVSQIGTLNRKDRLKQELDRLMVGYETQSSWMKLVASDFKVPAWQKSPLWVDSSNAHQCPKCHSTFKKLLSKKTNCRVCGRVFCSQCISKHELMLYVQADDGNEIGWAINGKEGGPKKHPRSLTLLQMCVICEKLLEEMLIEELDDVAEENWDTPEEDFMDTLVNLEATLFKWRLRIENLLPDYLSLVDSMDIVDGIPHLQSSKRPIHDLARVQSNLSDHFSQLAVDSQKLRGLEPQTGVQFKLLKNVTISVSKFYEDNMYIFRVNRKRIGQLMPIDSIEKIQQLINKISIERVHIFARLLVFETMNLDLRYKLACSTILQLLVQFVDSLELHMESYFKSINESWSDHCEAVKQMVREDYESGGTKQTRRIRIPSNIPKTPFRNIKILHKVLRQCAYYINVCLRELDAKTPESFFKASKKEMKRLSETFDSEVASIMQRHPQAFETNVAATTPPMKPQQTH